MITNKIEDKSSIFYPYVYWDNYFTDNELKEILIYCENKKLEKASILNDEIDKLRVSKVNFSLPDEENRWIFNKLNNFVELINHNFYGFDLTGYNVFQFTTYNHKENGHYSWHVDSAFSQPEKNGTGLQRKLSMTLLLNDDFEGGDFEINLSEPAKVDLVKGRAIFFPSFILHRVAPVTKGVRKSLVIWVNGPRWK